jgi:hypothetical protein
MRKLLNSKKSRPKMTNNTERTEMQTYHLHRRLLFDSALLVFALLLCLVLLAPGAKATDQCPAFDTAAVRRDLAAGVPRTDAEWYRTIILRMSRALDCERGRK